MILRGASRRIRVLSLACGPKGELGDGPVGGFPGGSWWFLVILGISRGVFLLVGFLCGPLFAGSQQRKSRNKPRGGLCRSKTSLSKSVRGIQRRKERTPGRDGL